MSQFLIIFFAFAVAGLNAEYICPDGSRSYDINLCPESYICGNGQTVTNPAMCLPPAPAPAPYPYPVIIPPPSPPQKEVHKVHCASITAITCWTDCAAFGEIPCICHTNWVLLLPTSIDCECRSPSEGAGALAVCAATSVGGFLKNFASG